MKNTLVKIAKSAKFGEEFFSQNSKCFLLLGVLGDLGERISG
jgi:hypothetical protein